MRLALATEDDVAQEVALLGTVLPRMTSDVAAGAAGKVIEYPFREGDRVEEGELLAELRSVTLRIELEAARAVEREKHERYKELAAGFREEEQREAIAAARHAQAVLKRIQGLHQRGATSDDALSEAESMAVQAEANRDLRLAGYRPEEIAQAKAAYEAQKEAVAQLEDELKKRSIEAPFGGYLVAKLSEVGQWIEQGGTVATLVDLSEVDVIVNVEESLIDLARLGKEVDVKFDALGGESLKGRILDLVPKTQWRGGSRSFPVKVRIENSLDENDLPRLKEGMLARVILRGEQHRAVLVPKDAVVRSSGKPVVYKLDKEDRAQPVEIVERLSYGHRVEIDGNIAPGDRLVVEGNERLRPAQKVAILKDPPEKPSS